MEYTYEMAGPNLKYKYRCHKPKSRYLGRSDNQGKPNRGILAAGLARSYRGKTRFK